MRLTLADAVAAVKWKDERDERLHEIDRLRREFLAFEGTCQNWSETKTKDGNETTDTCEWCGRSWSAIEVEAQPSIEISDAQLEVMLHALGSAHNADRANMGWRNYFSTYASNPLWDDLVSKGLAVLDGTTYRVSEIGLKLLGVTLKS